MSGGRFLFMGEQEDPEMDTIINRGGVRIYDATGIVPCTCYHAPEQHDEHGCAQESATGKVCPCNATTEDLDAKERAREAASPSLLEKEEI